MEKFICLVEISRTFLSADCLNTTLCRHFRRVSEERRNALELASRQQWMLMELEHERRKVTFFFYFFSGKKLHFLLSFKIKRALR